VSNHNVLAGIVFWSLLAALSSANAAMHWAIPLQHQSFPESKELPEPIATLSVEVREDSLVVSAQIQDHAPGALRGMRTAPDGFGQSDSHVLIYFDPLGDARFAQVFGLNIAGAVEDGLYRESGKTLDTGIDFVWDGEATLTASGWRADFRIPLKTLYLGSQPGAIPRIFAQYRRAGDETELYSTQDTSNDGGCLLCKAPQLNGFAVLAQGSPAWTLRPTAVFQTTRNVAVDAARWSDHSLRYGMDFSLRPSPSWLVAGTYHPNFSDREPDQPALTKDVQFSPLLAETRPFFTQGSDLHQIAPMYTADQFVNASGVGGPQIINTRQMANPASALQVIGRQDRFTSKWMFVEDEGGGSLIIPGTYANSSALAPKSQNFIGRGILASGSNDIGFTLSDRDYGVGAGANRVVGVDLVRRFEGDGQFSGSLAHAQTSACAGASSLVECPVQGGYSAIGALTRKQDMLDAGVIIQDVSQSFRNDLGWQPQSGYRAIDLWWWPSTAANLPAGLSRIDWQPEVLAKQDGAGRMTTRLLNLGANLTLRSGPVFGIVMTPVSQVRLAADQALVNARSIDMSLSFSPSPQWAKCMVEVKAGELPDYYNARAGHGYEFSVEELLAVNRELSMHLLGSWVSSRASDAQMVSGPTIREGSALLVLNYQYESFSKVRWATQWQRSIGWNLTTGVISAFSSSSVAHTISWIHEPRTGFGFSLNLSRQESRDNGANSRAALLAAKAGYLFW
jgi:hypothetical protein